MTFSVGDRVLAEDSEVSGYGTIIYEEQDGSGLWYGVEMDEKFRLNHTLDGRCPDGYGRWFRARSLRPAGPAVDERKFLEVIL